MFGWCGTSSGFLVVDVIAPMALFPDRLVCLTAFQRLMLAEKWFPRHQLNHITADTATGIRGIRHHEGPDRQHEAPPVSTEQAFAFEVASNVVAHRRNPG
jgi:hypothetical protein